ncbi:HNH endonuclease signature motif containing protein [Corynebacterium pacaense]|uniref:HNH endonuclease signature motif containing protein n=1 Tax=Corynebacterium pacaense TaxID=1816684 RepID=UPI0009BA2C00|nr:HNH endonuclease signature motif containing protein [Corynebacterium pacaense]
MTNTVFYSHQDPDNPESANNFEFTMLIHQRWAMLLVNRDSQDADSLIVELKRITGQSPHSIRQAVTAMEAMDNLPRLRLVQENHYFLSIAFLARIMEAVAQADPAHWEILDARLVDRLTPRSRGELLPEAGVIARLITMWIKELEPGTVTRRTRGSGTEEFLSFRHEDGFTEIRGLLSGVEGRRFHSALEKISKGKKSLVEALREFLDTRAPIRVVQYVYTPLTGGVSWMPQVGYLSRQDSQRLGGMVERTVPLDEVATRIESGYTPSPVLRAYVIARDATCRHPGCTVSADLCDIDHVIPFQQGGPTVAWNLQALCRHHHNMKSDGRFRATMDCLGDVRWIGPCNVEMSSRAQGPLAQEMPTGRWGQTMRARMDRRFAVIRAGAI